MAPSSAGTNGYNDAKDLLDSIGKIVHDEVKTESETYKDDLKGLLTSATLLGELSSSLDPCNSDYTTYFYANSKRYPCGTRKEDVKRFSDTLGGQCTDHRIKGNKNNCGACAPLRRLHVCVRNLENIKDVKKINNKDNLLLEVCMAAYYEGDSIKTPYTLHEQTNSDTKSQLCTVLARSFADIGDIIRGKDLYGGSKKEKEKREDLEKKLKEIFKQIHEGLKNGNNGELKTRYENDTKNYYQLREDWWYANRGTIWKAITCKAEGNTYFRKTCSDDRGGAQANNYCRCGDDKPDGDKPNTDPPTYFDYVPQYLRWFEEWAEDFCRKKKKKLENLQKQCRGKDKYNQERYCSRNGFDCEKTVRAKGKLRYGKQCTDCLYACYPYEKWIEKQKEQFDKQKNKYADEIKKYKNGAPRSSSRNKRAAGGTTKYEGYEKIFYEKLKEGGYEKVENFLEKLSKEDVCKKVQDPQGGKINFKEVNSGSASAGGGTSGASSTSGGASGTNVESQGTFYRSKYCQPCPYCGMKKKEPGEEWKPKQKDDNCTRGKRYKPKSDDVGTPIRILKSGKGETEIAEKLEQFCNQTSGSSGAVNAVGGSGTSGRQELYEEWKCYNDVEKDGQDGVDDDDEEDVKKVKDAGGLCILENPNKNKDIGKKSEPEPEEFQKTFHDLFYYWVAHMLKDSIYWRTKRLKRCLQNGNTIKCGKNCNNDCGCFKEWIEEKKKEWTAIKEHFGNQEDFKKEGESVENKMLGKEFESPDFVLQCNLQIEFLKGDSEDASAQDTQNSLDSEEIKHLRQMLQETGVVGGGTVAMCGIDVASGTEQKNIMDKLIEYERGIATKCKNCEQPEDKGLARSNTGPSPQSPGAPTDADKDHDSASEDDDDAEEEEEDEEEEEEEKQEGEDKGEDTAETVNGKESEEADPPAVDHTEAAKEEDGPDEKEQEEVGPKEDEVNPCQIVKTLFEKPEDFKDACTLKYVTGKNYGWKCIPSGVSTTTSGGDSTTSGELHTRKRREAGVPTATSSDATTGGSGATCIPPRRRKLYVGKLEEWANSDKTKASQKDGEAQTQSQVAVSQSSSTDNGVSTQPPQGQTPSESGDNKTASEKLRTAFIESAAVETFFLWHKYKQEKEIEKQEKKKRESGLLVPLLGTDASLDSGGEETPENQLASGTIPEEFKRQMFYTLGDYRDICVGVKEDVINALEASGDKNIETIKEAIDKILNSGNKENSGPKPVQTPKEWWDTNAQHMWHGMICALTYKDNTDSGAKGATSLEQIEGAEKILEQLKGKYGDYNSVKLDNSGDDPLTNFISRPPYFRYLEEWGQNFCKERKKRLEEVEKGCKVEANGRGNEKKPKCSCDGESCEDMFSKKYDTFSSLECPDCAKHCSSYRKWIGRKKYEFTEQQNAFTKQKGNAESNKNDYKEFINKLQTNNEAGDFLTSLKLPCKTDNGDSNIPFDKNGETFQHTDYCAACPITGVNCKNGDCSKDKEKECKNKTITKEDIEKKTDGNENIDMLVSDNSGNGNKFNDLQPCEHANIFKGIRKDQWKCGNFCGYVVCKPVNVNGNKNGENPIIQIRALFKRWVDNFFEDYNRIKHKISHCTKSENKSKCIRGCNHKCNCVKQWIKLKQQEWEKIKERFNEQYKNKDSGDYPVKTFLEELIPQIGAANDKGKHETLEKLEESLGCNCPENSQKNDGNKSYVIDCMIKKLEKKIDECNRNHNPSSEKQSECKEPPHDDEQEPLEEENENQVKAPEICKDVLPEPQPETGEKGDCKTDPPQPDVKEEEEEKEEEKDKGDKEQSGAPSPSAPGPLPPPPPPPLAPSDESILQTTIPFGVALALGSIAFLFLKKKTKSSVGNLFQILQIPKSDYDIPTKLSPNRYIPYTSGKYRGKRYIYLEGDSGTDSGYTDHYSDITSSSESEYEEMDINDIYVPGSPKYKTLIEVVLEPSGNNTTASGNNTPSDNTPTNKFDDNEWNTLKDDFISNMLQNQPKDVPNDYTSGDIPFNTQPNTLYFDKPEEKPFITSIHDRNLYSGEEYNYDMSTNSGNNDLYNGKNNLYSGENNVYSGIDPTSDNRGLTSGKHDSYSGIDLINDTLSGNHNVDIYDELLKRKENELFGTNHVKQTSIHSVAKPISDDPIHNQLELFHKWLDRHRDMCEKWENHHERLAKLKEEWENETHSGNTHPSDSNKTLNTDVSIQIDMNNPKTTNEFTYVDTILDDLETHNEPYYDVQDDIYYDVNDHDTSTVDSNNMDVPSKVQIEMDINTKLVKEKYPIADVWDI